MKIAAIGAGRVGGARADHLATAGHDVTIATTHDGSASVARALAKNPRLQAAPIAAAVAAADVIFLATPFAANEGILLPLHDALAGKIVVACTNPVGPGLSHGLQSATSGSETVQALVPGARVVKAFSIYGYENFEDPAYPGHDVKPAMLFCGDDADAKAAVATLIADVGFEPVDVGGLVRALHLEPMTLLWVRMVRAQGQSPHMVWGALRRSRPLAATKQSVAPPGRRSPAALFPGPPALW
jgi:predicted dinucleotide-binding enzyme